jgi:hypothetical protein
MNRDVSHRGDRLRLMCSVGGRSQSVWDVSKRTRGEASDRNSIPKAPFFFYYFVYDHMIMVEKLDLVVLTTQFGNFIL